MQATADKLLCEFFMLHPPESAADKYVPEIGSGIPPLYRDFGDLGKTNRGFPYLLNGKPSTITS
jgi:hypothetical protein